LPADLGTAGLVPALCPSILIGTSGPIGLLIFAGLKIILDKALGLLYLMSRGKDNMKPMLLMFHAANGERVTYGIRSAYRMLRETRGIYETRRVIAHANSGETVFLAASGNGNDYFAVSEDYALESA
jgi:hypothetical protein